MLPDPPLLLITDRHQARGHILDVANKALAAGCRWISLREKDLPEEDQISLLHALLDRAQEFAGCITLHGDPALARRARAHGAHLAAGDDVAGARHLLGEDALIGLSVHNADEARMLDAQLADYLVAGPLFETASKPGYGPTLDVEGLALIVKASSVPVIAIGGINSANVPDCLRAGAAGVAVMGGVMRAKNPGDAVAQLIGALTASL